MANFKPTYNKVVVEIDKDKEVTKGGIIIPVVAQKERRSVLGTVIAVGPGRVLESGVTNPCCVSVGDRVMVTEYAGSPVKIGENCYTVLPDQDIICILPKEV